MKKLLIASAITVTILLISSCASVTKIDATWKTPNLISQKYNKIVVLGLANNLARRSAVENSIVNNLVKNGYNAVAGSAILPTDSIDVNKDGKLDEGVKERLVQELKAAGIDGALVFALNDVQKSTQYVPGTVNYVPPVGMYGFRGYYSSMYNNIYGYGGTVLETPGHYVENSEYIMTTNFYNVTDETLLWSTQSGTMNPSSVSDFANSYGDSVVDAFVKSGVASK